MGESQIIINKTSYLFNKFLLVYMLVLFSPLLLTSQTVFISYSPLNTLKPTLYELFYCSLNNTGQSEDIFLQATVSKDGEVILAAESGNFFLEQGITTINAINAESIVHSINDISSNYTYSQEIYDQIVQTGYIPAGDYQLCLIAYNLNNEILSNPDICYSFISWPVSAPKLLIPNDNSEIATRLPLFSWTHAMPYNPSFTYLLEVVELYDGQGPFDAFQSNYLYFKSEDIYVNLFQYQISALPLEDCKTYAWRITGSYDPNLSEYEYRVFHTKCDSILTDEEEETITSSNIYYKLNRSIDESFFNVSKNFKIVVDNPYAFIEKISYSLYDNDHIDIAASNTLINLKSNNENLHAGNNIFIVNIERLGLLPDEYYVLEVEGPKRKRYLKIKYITEE